MKRTHIGILLVGAALLWTAGCGSDDEGTGPSGPVAGTLTVNLTTPNADDRAMHLSIQGAGAADSVSNVQLVNASFTLLSRVEGGNEAEAAVFGDLADGALVRFSVPDVNSASRYTASIVDVADGSNEVRSDLSGYNLQIEQ